ncbi:MAG TPA: transglycosylase domain-containing protein, partial [Candidatus Limnocylindrales bacterium]
MQRRRIARAMREPGRDGRLGRTVAALLGGLCLAIFLLVGATGLVVSGVVGALSRDLPDPTRLDGLAFNQPTVVYDRSGKVVLATFQQEERRVVSFDAIPHLVLDATTTAEDRSFWSNLGFDGTAIFAAIAQNASGSPERGASTITQQLVRARLLPAGLAGPGEDRYLRKAKEIIQAIRVTNAFPGEAGKARIITAYLNEIFYGHGAYGVAAAAKIYFGISDLADLTPAQAALLAGLPKSPTTLDPYRYAKPDAKGRLIVPPDSPPAIRRNWILTGLAAGARWTRLSQSELSAALAEPIVLARPTARTVRAGHFDQQVRRDLDRILGDPKAADTGGYTVITTLDWRAQQLAEKWMTAAAIVPNLSVGGMDKWLTTMHVGAADRGWIRGLRGKDVHDGALVALDYRTGDVLAYVGSAGFGRDSLASPQFSPKFDAAGDGLRQPGSAFKPVVYATAFDRRKLTPGSLLLDVTTEFDPAQHWAPHDADQLERGPVLVRGALQYSLNVPAIRALQRVGNAAVAATAAKLGIRFQGGHT